MIGVFDSGIGGLSVVREIFRELPGHQVLYFGDTARSPYGTKSAETIVRYSVQNTEFLLEKGAKIIVVACNSASAVATDALKEKFPETPIFEVVSPAAEKAAGLTKNGKIGVIGTRATIGSGIYERLIGKINPKANVFSKSCPLLVPLVEEDWAGKPETKTIVRKYLYPLKMKQADTLVLGCTHYPFLEKIIRHKIGRKVRLVDPGKETAVKIRKFLEDNPEIKKTLAVSDQHRFFVSDLTPHFREISLKWLGQPIELSKL